MRRGWFGGGTGGRWRWCSRPVWQVGGCRSEGEGGMLALLLVKGMLELLLELERELQLLARVPALLLEMELLLARELASVLLLELEPQQLLMALLPVKLELQSMTLLA